MDKKQEIERTIANVAFSMRAEGFDITRAQENDWRNVLTGKENSQTLLEKYKRKAVSYGEKVDA